MFRYHWKTGRRTRAHVGSGARATPAWRPVRVRARRDDACRRTRPGNIFGARRRRLARAFWRERVRTTGGDEDGFRRHSRDGAVGGVGAHRGANGRRRRRETGARRLPPPDGDPKNVEASPPPGGKTAASVRRVRGVGVRVSHLPSGVVEVLQVPEEAGLFLLVAGRVLVQDAGHAWSLGGPRARDNLSANRLRLRLRRRTTREREPDGPGKRARLAVLVSAGRPRAFHTTSSSSSAASASLSPAAGRYLRRGGSVDGRAHPALLARTLAAARPRSPVGGGRASRIASSAGRADRRRGTGRVFYLFLFYVPRRSRALRTRRNHGTKWRHAMPSDGGKILNKKYVTRVTRRCCGSACQPVRSAAVFRAGPTRRAR